MKISTKGRYALTIMLYLARNYDNTNYVSLTKIANEEGISLKYLERIISNLKKNGLVLSSTGKDGGYKLVKEPMFYTIGEIIRSADENLEVANCINSNPCPKKSLCKTYSLWEGLDKQINDYLDNKYLSEYI